MLVSTFLDKLSAMPQSVEFTETMAVIDANYQFTATQFVNGEQVNAAGENSGSCKLFSFAQLHHLDKAKTLACFGSYYRDDVLKHPQASDHQNIRQFMINGWPGIKFSGVALLEK
ncbi:MAG: HopJ type III effector protein [Psychromonas sp.]|nr:HopJ type III effector protein [Psychromonas sp.]